MFRSLELHGFKSFDESRVQLAPFTLLVGANAGGKSNIREAFRFLHGISRGYSLAEIVGEKWIEGGFKVWTGLRGGASQIALYGTDRLSLRASFTSPEQFGRDSTRRMSNFAYRIDIGVSDSGSLRVLREHLHEGGRYVYDTHPEGDARGGVSPMIKARIRKGGAGFLPDDNFLEDRPILTQMLGSNVARDATRRTTRAAIDFLESMVFLDLNPDAAREASGVGIHVLGDRGENLSSVLAEICTDEQSEAVLTSWIRALTPMDAVELQFQTDFNGRVIAILVESNGAKTPLSAASDGTLRFLAVIAALMNPARSRFLFFEEIENGIHPNRQHLLLELIEQSVATDRSQVVATSHSPQLLVHAYRALDAKPNLVFRGGSGGSEVVDLRGDSRFAAVLEDDDPAALMTSGWLEDVASIYGGASQV